ncbi:MAG: hypothetical protein N3F09_07830 [Bacteroidia bacterium]|nr:hypothetical protein [Bacteroidia bacterium]
MNKFSVIDCGTNTFNLIIFGVYPFKNIVYQEKSPVKIGSGLNSTGLITNEAAERAVSAMKRFYELSREFNSEKIIAIGTSAFRDALNAEELIKKIFSKTGIKIEVIDGDREAELIAKGILFGFDPPKIKTLILDIGGGSNECIILGEDHSILWKISYPLGMARILGQYPHSDPITTQEIKFYEEMFTEKMYELRLMTQLYKPALLLGASGAFDTIHEMIESDQFDPNKNFKVSQEAFEALYKKVVHSTYKERENMKGLIAMRRDMIVLSLILIRTVMKITGVTDIFCCKGSLKEGVVSEILNDIWQ